MEFYENKLIEMIWKKQIVFKISDFKLTLIPLCANNKVTTSILLLSIAINNGVMLKKQNMKLYQFLIEIL